MMIPVGVETLGIMIFLSPENQFNLAESPAFMPQPQEGSHLSGVFLLFIYQP